MDKKTIMEFKSYPKIHRLGKDEVEGILVGFCCVQEKIDGANTSIWRENGEIKIGSRRRELGDESFNGFREYVKNHEGIDRILRHYPNTRLYGEWLVKHTISYKETAYRKFYLFDIEQNDKKYSTENVERFAKKYDIAFPQIFMSGEDLKYEEIKEFVGKTNIGENGEGVVIKNMNYTNKFGDNVYAKIVTEKFKEKNSITFGGNNKHADTYWEMYVVNKYITLPRVKKIIQKLQPEINEKLDMKHIPRICHTVYHDMIQEEMWEIQKKVQSLNFKTLQRLCMQKSKQIFVDILEDSLSVADTKI